MSNSRVSFNVRQINEQVSAIDIHGDLTAAAENELNEAYNQAISENTRTILINCTGMGQVDAGGAGLLAELLIRANRQGQRLAAVGIQGQQQQHFGRARLDEAFQTFEDESTALKTLQGS